MMVLSVVVVIEVLLFFAQDVSAKASSKALPQDLIGEDLSTAEVVVPVVTAADDNKDLVTVTVTHDSSQFHLVLEKNHGLLSDRFTAVHYDSHGREVISENNDNCYYHGKVSGKPDWFAVISLCDGIRGFFGNKHVRFYVAPLEEEEEKEKKHIVYKAADNANDVLKCETESQFDTSGIKTVSLVKSLFDQRQVKVGIREHSLTIELVIVNDYAQVKKFDSDEKKAKKEALRIANYADYLLYFIGVRVSVVQVISWTRGDPITASTDSNKYIDRFQEYAAKNIQKRQDASMLFTNVKLSSSGKAMDVGAACTDQSVSIVKTRGYKFDYIGGTAAHELGHLIGMIHDHDHKTKCTCGHNKFCIMCGLSDCGDRDVNDADLWAFSDCSERDLDKWLKNNHCLEDESTTETGYSSGV